jgi:hypothetical protein
LISKTNLSLIIAESKFLSEDHLISLLKSIVRITEGHIASQEGIQNSGDLLEFSYDITHAAMIAANSYNEENLPFSLSSSSTASSIRTVSYPIHYYRNSENFLDTRHFISSRRITAYSSASSIAWLEMMLVELSLRNRDRFAICWPILKAHYQKCLGNHFTQLSYVSERYDLMVWFGYF